MAALKLLSPPWFKWWLLFFASRIKQKLVLIEKKDCSDFLPSCNDWWSNLCQTDIIFNCRGLGKSTKPQLNMAATLVDYMSMNVADFLTTIAQNWSLRLTRPLQTLEGLIDQPPISQPFGTIATALLYYRCIDCVSPLIQGGTELPILKLKHTEPSQRSLVSRGQGNHFIPSHPNPLCLCSRAYVPLVL